MPIGEPPLMDKQDIIKKIEEKRTEMKEVKGTKCEVYSRVVGYLRPVQNFNKGKRVEYGMRKTYKIEE